MKTRKSLKKYVHNQNNFLLYIWKRKMKEQNDHGWSSQWTMCFAIGFYMWLSRSKWSLDYSKLWEKLEDKSHVRMYLMWHKFRARTWRIHDIFRFWILWSCCCSLLYYCLLIHPFGKWRNFQRIINLLENLRLGLKIIKVDDLPWIENSLGDFPLAIIHLHHSMLSDSVMGLSGLRRSSSMMFKVSEWPFADSSWKIDVAVAFLPCCFKLLSFFRCSNGLSEVIFSWFSSHCILLQFLPN